MVHAVTDDLLGGWLKLVIEHLGEHDLRDWRVLANLLMDWKALDC